MAIDRQERVLNFNQSAARLFGVDAMAAKGRPLQEVLRHLDLQNFLHQSLLSDRPLEGEIVLRTGAEELFLQAHGTHLHNAAGEIIGALVVLNDVTNLRHLERIRRDFVANVSHELRTPVTSIRGFVETLLDGAIDEPEQAREFLAIIARQSERLNAIIEDLLSLSRVERETEKQSLMFEKCEVAALLRAAVQTCEVEAAAKAVPVSIQCPEDLTAIVNGQLLEQAVVNLVSNAIKYTDSPAPVEVSAREEGPFLFIRVRDQGRGIARRHLDRLFERFYRVDKGRNRGGGGTGLGLAIVKHIMLAHHGRVTVESAPGQGSTFTLQLPLQR